uniref:DNA primase n=1 Tax=Dromaius novaehollandiae TaxID=8790 RepID=A0A8C4JVJ1_DRONO
GDPGGAVGGGVRRGGPGGAPGVLFQGCTGTRRQDGRLPRRLPEPVPSSRRGPGREAPALGVLGPPGRPLLGVRRRGAQVVAGAARGRRGVPVAGEGGGAGSGAGGRRGAAPPGPASLPPCPQGGAETVKKVTLSEPVHPFVRRSVSVVERYFAAYALEGQDILGSRESWEKVLALVPEEHREPLRGEFPKKRDSAQRWELLRARMERTRRAAGAGKSPPCHADWEIMLQYCFPRLDINVSRGVGHLLKSPFSVHPKTGGSRPPRGPPPSPCPPTAPPFPAGRISVPLDLQRLEQFDPFAVPTISSLCQELDAAGELEDGGEAEPKRRPRDYKRTSLAPYVRLFEQFVEGMEQARRGEALRRSDLQGDF